MVEYSEVTGEGNPQKGPTMLGSIGLTELLVVAVLLILVFGGKRLPHLGRDLGQAIKNFKKGLAGEKPAAPKQLPKDDGPRGEDEAP